MTRIQLLQLLVGQARAHGFEFRKWYTANTGLPWADADTSIEWLARGQRANILLFSHPFARAFWRSGERLTFIVPHQTFQRVAAGGGSVTVQRRAHIRSSSRTDVWEFHLREMAATAEPLRYIRRFLLMEETMEEAEAAIQAAAKEEEDDNYDNESLVRDAG
jgi:hypothetical protein